jgi:hypothetical protein
MTNLKNQLKGGFLGIPNLGILKQKEANGVKPLTPTPSSASTELSTPSSTPRETPPETQSIPSDEEKKKICLEAADKKAKEAAEDKKKCETDFPRKKILGIFGGKKRKSKSKKGKSGKSSKTNKKKRRSTKKSSR